MDWTARLLTATLMTIVMLALVTFIGTLLNLGFDPDFFRQWGKAYLVVWPIAAIAGFLIMPTARGGSPTGFCCGYNALQERNQQ